MPVTTFRELILAHKGKRICVMGGAKSLADDLAKVEADVYISANEHGTPYPHDYIIAMDRQHGSRKLMKDVLRAASDKPIISPEEFADYRLTVWPSSPRRLYSGMVGAWCAWAMGARVVILAGMDGYQGSLRAKRQADTMAEEIRCPVRVVSGPLADVFGLYDPSERFGRYAPHNAIHTLMGANGETRVRVRKETAIEGINYIPGDEWAGPRHSVAKQLRHKMVIEL